MVSRISGGFLDWSEDICNVSVVSLVPNLHPPTLGVQMTPLHSCLFVTCCASRQQLGPLALRTTGTRQPTCCHLSVVVASSTANCNTFRNDIFRTHGMFFITARLLTNSSKEQASRDTRTSHNGHPCGRVTSTASCGMDSSSTADNTTDTISPSAFC